MKKLLIFGLLLHGYCFASGRIQVKPSYHLKSEKVGGQVGIAIYEKLPLGLAYNSWTGGGLAPRIGESGAIYLVSEHKLGKPAHVVGDVGVWGGYAFRWANQHSESLLSESSLFVQVEMKIW